MRIAVVSLGIAVASSALVVVAACGASSDRNFKLGTGNATCFDIDSDCTSDRQCCSTFCANGTCVRRER
jgi:hypothetical protein